MSDQASKTDLGVEYTVCPIAQDPAEVKHRHEDNRAAWNEAAEEYATKLEETISFLKNGGSNLHPLERDNLGTLREWCNTAIHLQCASGKDTLSLWNEGVKEIVGIDISEIHIANAKRTAIALGAPARWYCCDVLEAPSGLDGTADLVYTGRGALCWLHDLPAWGRVIHRLLKPGGVMHILDDHPVTWLFDMETTNLTPSCLDYFTHCESSRGWPSSYLGDMRTPVEEQATKYERLWNLADVFSALRGSGLSIERLGEHREGYWESFPNLREDQRAKIPLTFSILARKLP